MKKIKNTRFGCVIEHRIAVRTLIRCLIINSFSFYVFVLYRYDVQRIYYAYKWQEEAL